METYYKIYRIINLINGREYYGYTGTSIEQRFEWHCGKTSGCYYISRAIQKYGKENFKIEHLLSILSQDEVMVGEIEDSFIVKYNSLAPNGYNLKRGGANGKMCEETKERMRNSQLARYVNMPEEVKNSVMSGINYYINNKKEKVVGVNIVDASFIRFESQTIAEKEGYFVFDCLSGKANVSKNHCWFYDEGQDDQYFIIKTLEIIEEFGTYSKGKNSWKKCDREQRKQAQIDAAESRRKPIIAISRFDLSIKEFEGLAFARRAGFTSGSVFECLRGNAKHAHDHFWCYKEDGKSVDYYIEKAKLGLKDKLDSTNMSPVVSVEITSGKETHYKNLYEAEKAGFRISGIRRVLRGDRASFNGYLWKSI